LLLQHDGVVRSIAAGGEQLLAERPSEPLPVVAVRDVLARWQNGETPATGVEDCYRAMRLVDQAYETAGR
jgi:hypothetical protein